MASRDTFVVKQTVQFEFDMESVWDRVRGRRCVFLDSNAWIHMSDGRDETAGRVRDDLRARVAGGKVFCPVSWGTLEELFLQAGASLPRTAALMEELSLNACIIIRRELFQWEFARSLGRCLGAPVDESLKGLFTTPSAFNGSRPCVTFDVPQDQVLGPDAVANAQEHFRQETAAIGIVELTRLMAGGARPDDAPPGVLRGGQEGEGGIQG